MRSRITLRRLFPWIIVLALTASEARSERPRVYALTHANVVPAPGERVENGTVVIRDGLIEAVGEALAVPPDAVEIDVEGGWVYAGLIDADSMLSLGAGTGGASSSRGGGAAASGAPSRSQQRPGPVHPIGRVHPERRVRDRLLPFTGDGKREMERFRELGFTTVLAQPDTGIFRGRSAAIQLADDSPVAELILRDDVAQHVAFERGSFGDGYPTSLMGAVATIRQTLLDAGRQVAWSERYRNDPGGMRRPDRHAAHQALADVLNRTQPVHVRAESAHDALLADRLGDEFELDVVISASGREWEVASAIAAADRVLLYPVARPEKPKVKEDIEALNVSRRTMRRYLEAASGPARLRDAGVRFALVTRGLKSRADFPDRMREIVEAGLTADEALAALTTTPARVLGLGAVLGTLEPGKIANVVVADAPLFDEESELSRVFVDGREYAIDRPEKPQGDPNAVVDPRGEWSVVFEFGQRTIERVWTIAGERGAYEGTAETRSGTVTFDEVELKGNLLTVTFPAQGERGPTEISLIVEGDAFEGTAEMGSRSVPIAGTRTRGPEGGQR